MLDSFVHQSQVEAHKAATRASLMQIMQASRLSQREIANNLGIGETYLSKVLHEDSYEQLSSALVQKLARQLNVSSSLHDEIQWHLEDAMFHDKITKQALQDEPTQKMFDVVFQQRIGALLSPQPSEAKELFGQIQIYGRQVVSVLFSRRAYYHAARAALVLNDVFHTLNRLPSAMFYAKLASQLLFSPPLEIRERHEDFKDYYVNAIYAEGVTLRLLGFHRQARKKHLEIIQNHASSPWYSHAHRENLMAYLLNTSIQKNLAFALLKAHQDSLGALESTDKVIWEFTAQRTEAEIWLSLGQAKRSLEILNDLHTRIAKTVGMTNVHQTSFLRLYGKAFFRAHQKSAAWDMFQKGLFLAVSAGLTHQKGWIEADLRKF